MYGGTSFSRGGKLGYSIFKSALKFLSILKKDSEKKVSGQEINGTILQIILTRNQFNISRALEISQNPVFFEKCYSKNRSVRFYSRKKLLAFLFNHPRAILQELTTQEDHLLKENWIRIIKLLWIKSVLIEILECSKSIKYLINYNDHSPYNVMIHQIGKEYDITTIYIQHANVSKKFPPLYHDINLLFNQKSLDTYKAVGKVCNKVELIGDIRLKHLKEFKSNPMHKKVLICPNKLDDVGDVIDFSKRMKKNGYKPIIRPHPSDKRWRFIRKVDISRNRSVKEDLEEASFLVTNESAIIIEGIYVNLLSYLYQFKNAKNTPQVFDNYGFIQEGLIKKKLTNYEELLSLMKNKKDLVNIEFIDAYIGSLTISKTLKILTER